MQLYSLLEANNSGADKKYTTFTKYPKPDSSARHHLHPIPLTYILISPSHYAQVFQVQISFKFSTKIINNTHVPHVPPISYSLIWSYTEHFVSRTYHEAPHYAIFSSPVTSCLSPKSLPQHPILKRPQPTIFPSCETPSCTPTYLK